MAFNINDMRSQLVTGGARPTLFQVRLQNPANSAGDVKFPFMCTATQIPASTVGTIPVLYFGREVKFAGDRTFEPWNVQVLNDEDFLIRNALEEWSGNLNKHEGNIREYDAPLQYKSTAQVIQYSKTGVPIREYTFHGIWPTQIDPIDLDWSNQNAIELFGVTFEYDWWSVSGGSTGNAGGPV